MKRKVIWISAILIAVVVIGYAGTVLFVGSIVTAGVNHFAPAITQTTVRLDSAHLSPVSGSGTLNGLFVGNPAGWSGDKAFSVAKIHVSVVPSSIFSDCIVLKDVTIDGAEFVYETKVISSNVGDLLKNIEGTSDSNSTSSQPATKQGKPLKFIVQHFALTNGKVTLGLGPTAITLPMPPITLDDLGTKEGGITPAQLSLSVMRSVTGGVVSATTQAAGKIGSTMGAAAGNSAKSAGAAIKSLFGDKH